MSARPGIWAGVSRSNNDADIDIDNDGFPSGIIR